MNLRLSIVVLLLLAFIGTGCKSKKAVQVNNPPTQENFEDFYQRFHQDEQFQLTRIAFPIDGSFIDHKGEQSWNRNNWTPLKTMIQDVDENDYDIETTKSADRFYQKVWIEGSGFLSEYTWQRIDGKWYLTYAKEVNL